MDNLDTEIPSTIVRVGLGTLIGVTAIWLFAAVWVFVMWIPSYWLYRLYRRLTRSN